MATFTKPTAFAAVAVYLLAANPAAAAGAHGGGHGHGFAFGQPGNPADVTRTIDIVMKENLYEPDTVAVEPGETVRFRIVNRGELVHEFNLGTARMHAAHQKEMQMIVEHGVLEPDRINHKMMKMGGGKAMEHNDPNSVLLEPGKSGEVLWKFTKAAKLEFACNVPGHYQAGMKGRIRFK